VIRGYFHSISLHPQASNNGKKSDKLAADREEDIEELKEHISATRWCEAD
jgi:hypothetical protein